MDGRVGGGRPARLRPVRVHVLMCISRHSCLCVVPDRARDARDAAIWRNLRWLERQEVMHLRLVGAAVELQHFILQIGIGLRYAVVLAQMLGP